MYESDEDDNPLPTFDDEESLAPYQGSHPDTVKALLALGQVSASDVLYDLGCGDARIPIAAAFQYGCRAVGVEKFVFDKAQRRLADEIEIAKNAPSGACDLQSLVSIREEDALTCDMSDCTICVLFLLPDGLKQLKERLESLLNKGVRLVTIFWPIKFRKPINMITINNTSLYYYTSKSEPVDVAL